VSVVVTGLVDRVTVLVVAVALSVEYVVVVLNVMEDVELMDKVRVCVTVTLFRAVVDELVDVSVVELDVTGLLEVRLLLDALVVFQPPVLEVLVLVRLVVRLPSNALLVTFLDVDNVEAFVKPLVVEELVPRPLVE